MKSKGGRPTALGVYIFAGGFTLGVKKHFDVLTHFEDGPYGTETAIKNKLIKEAHIDPATWPIKQYAGKVDFLYGNPPCAPWSISSAGRATHWTEDPRINAVVRMSQLLDTIKPTVWAWESVRPTFVKGRSFVNEVAALAQSRGYYATVLMVNGAHHGVAQVRKRMFLVLSKVNIGWDKGTHEHARTVREALKGIEAGVHWHDCHAELEPNQLPPALARAVKPGMRVAKVWNDLNPNAVRLPGEKMAGRPGFLKYRLHWDKPSPVLLGGASNLHPKFHRYISIAESAAICGYPKTFEFVGSRSKQYAQVAQAVMPPVAEYLAKMVARGLRQNSRVRKPGYERVEVFYDRVERGPLDTVLRMDGGLKLVELPTRPLPARRTGTIKNGETPPWKQSGTTYSPRANSQYRPPVKKGSGVRIRELLAKGWDAERILETIKKEFAGSKATKADVYWNRRQIAIGRFSV